jgi:FemAB-related protein (PEP-CTERM system-associated)
MKLTPFDFARDRQRWDEFVRSQAAGSFFHLSGWHQVIATSYGQFQPCYYLVEEQGEIQAVIPATLVKRPFTGTALISNPFAVSAGPLCASGCDIIQLLGLLAEAHANVDYLELRDVSSAPDHWQTTQHFVNFAKTLTADHEENWLAIPNRQRAVIRKAEAKDLSLDTHRDLQRFLDVYSISLRNLGTPIYPKRYFHSLLEQFKEQIILVTVAAAGKDLTTVLCFQYKDRLMPYYGGGTIEARDFHAYPWMYWQLMKYGVDHQMPTFDFGRSPDKSGPYAFKKNLGFKPRKLNYSYLPLQGKVPDLTGSSGIAKHLISVWQKLPLPVANLVGPLGAVYAV